MPPPLPNVTDLLDVVVRKGATVLKLLAGEDQALLVRRNALLVLNLGLDIVDRVRGLDLKGDGLARKGLHEAVGFIASVSNFDARFVRIRGWACRGVGRRFEGKPTSALQIRATLASSSCFPPSRCFAGVYSLVLDFREPAPGRWMKSGEFTAIQFLVGLEIWPRLGQSSGHVRDSVWGSPAQCRTARRLHIIQR